MSKKGTSGTPLPSGAGLPFLLQVMCASLGGESTTGMSLNKAASTFQGPVTKLGRTGPKENQGRVGGATY